MSSTLQNKILNYEVTPPAGAWKKIEDALDESELTHQYPSKLFTVEIIPPVSAWNKIATSLDAENAINNTENRRIVPFFKYAAAAVVIGLLAWGGIQLLNNNSSKNDLAKKESTVTEKISAPPQFNPSTETNAEPLAATSNDIATDDARNDAALEASKKTFAKLDIPVKTRIREIASGYSFDSSPGIENTPGVLSNHELIECDLSSRYINLISPEGNMIRISKKLTDMACCVSGEEVNNECKDQMKRLQEKIACSPACHSTGSFMDVLDLVKSLQDN
jgi:hypothetical protein